MTAWPRVALGELVEFLDHRRRPVTEKDRVVGPYPYYGANGQQGTVDGYIFDEPLLLLAEDGGHFDNPSRGIAYTISGKTWVNNHAHVIRTSSDLDLDYACRALENLDVRRYVTGTTRAKLTKAGASRIEIPLPPLTEQRRIASILDRADALRAKRSEAVAKIDELAQSIFGRTFGEWKTEPLGNYLNFITSGGRGWAKYYADSGSRFIRSLDVQMNSIDSGNIAYVNAPDNAEARRTITRLGDVLLTITGSQIGRVAPVTMGFEGSYISQHVAILRPDMSKLNSIFLSQFLSLPGRGQRLIAGAQYGQTKPGLNFDQIRAFAIPVPPLQLQEEFARRIYEIDTLKSVHRFAAAELDSLFATLQSRAFKAEL